MTPAELRALLAKATPGPWMHDADDNASVQADCACVERQDADYGPEEVGSMSCDDARAIVAMRNGYDALLDVAEAAQRLVDRSASIDETHPAYGFLVMAIPLAKALAKLGTP